MTGSSVEGFYHEWSSDSVDWLHRRDRAKEQVVNADLVRILSANPDLIADPILRDYLILGLEGQLKGRRGRKRLASRRLRDLHIITAYETLLPYLQLRFARERKGARKERGASGPAEYLCEIIGKRYGLEPEGIRNLVSSLKKRRN